MSEDRISNATIDDVIEGVNLEIEAIERSLNIKEITLIGQINIINQYVVIAIEHHRKEHVNNLTKRSILSILSFCELCLENATIVEDWCIQEESFDDNEGYTLDDQLESIYKHILNAKEFNSISGCEIDALYEIKQIGVEAITCLLDHGIILPIKIT